MDNHDQQFFYRRAIMRMTCGSSQECFRQLCLSWHLRGYDPVLDKAMDTAVVRYAIASNATRDQVARCAALENADFRRAIAG